MKCVTFLLILALTASCTTTPAPEDITNVPQERLFGFTKTSDGHLVILAGASLGSDCTVRVSIDEKPAARFFGAEVAHFGLTFGSHTLSARTSDQCFVQWAQEISISVKAGDALIIRIDKAGLVRTELLMP